RENLEKIADFIETEFTAAGALTERQRFRHSGLYEFQNVIGRYGPDDPALPRIVVGAHYDAYREYPGADDNASGVAGIVEISHLLGKIAGDRFERPVELVCWPLEEPPFFRSPSMGNAAHAKWLKESNVKIQLMICLEMIGYYSDEPGSQRYPNLILHLFYPSRANFITVVGNLHNRPSVALAKAAMRGTTPLPVHSIAAPNNLPGIDFSDHINFWSHGYPAIMISDTAFYRNDRYHTERDTADTLDYDRMAQATVATFELIRSIALKD
ncbi:MAG: M28 family peptidase, partial [Verrucomicrobiae bacterium]|nr:M28 family peptidase [Verrucomicrobiae bacterium]